MDGRRYSPIAVALLEEMLSSRLREEGPCARRRRAKVGGRDPRGLGAQATLPGTPHPPGSYVASAPSGSGGRDTRQGFRPSLCYTAQPARRASTGSSAEARIAG